MTPEEEIEDSLQICHEIEKFHDKESNTTNIRVNSSDDSALKHMEEEIHPNASPVTEEYIEQHPIIRKLLRVFCCILCALILSLLITKFVAHHTSVEGSSMENSLQNGDQLIVENISYYLHDPERYDIIVFPFDSSINYIKRIIGLPGETIQIKDGYIYINGEQLEKNFGKEQMEDAGLAAEEIVLGDDEYFVLGDNRNASIDSRKSEVGVVHRNEIEGKAWFRFYPFSSVSLIQ